MMACSFCAASPLKKPPQDVVAFAARQVAAACRQRPAGAERRFEFRCQGLWRRLEELIRELIRLQARQAELIFAPRIDELLATRDGLRRCLPLLAGSGLAVRIYGMGVENFSPQEHLRLNGAHIAHCPLISPCGVLGQRLQLFAKRPITALARHDGLVVAGRRPFYNSGCIIRAELHEIPWRFKHPEVALVWQLSQRLAAAGKGQAPKDGLDEKVAGLLARAQAGPPDPLPAFRRAVALMLRRPRPQTLERLVELLASA